ncbi:metal ABC transporter substrate-binding protein [Marinithermus hydrothermalis]|uniref:ABC-type metal ion transporter, periplasmic subunit n=1 Tax=Marinithermus hydrothermalis (strain DSM 14884 / JCM 11576 / T1) TaxID=869210 RepID=F2NM70_MARHT|nr:metal ABC transporter substrate-binding protein [Marinithermus hydrothermalis]AEB11540.1 ABC-type metal ion transporter, periplasmic subunit [Marinithermus hydrothermalis DSM 14884]
MHTLIWTLLLSLSPWGLAQANPTYVATIPPLKMILEPLVQGRAEVTALLPPGASPHTFEPRPSDLRRLTNAQALFYVAPEFDGWAARLPAQTRVEVLPLVPEAYRRHFTAGEEHAGETDRHGGTDPHFWTDPLTVQATLPALVDALCELDPPGCPQYQENATAFAAELEALAEELEAKLAPLEGRPVLLFHESLGYFLDRYGLRVAAVLEPFPGKEPTPRYLKEILKTVREAGVRAVFTEPQLPKRPAEVIAEAAGIRLHVLDPLGGTEGRATYPELMRYNARALLEALE